MTQEKPTMNRQFEFDPIGFAQWLFAQRKERGWSTRDLAMRAGISQKILKDKGTFRINVSDIFYTNQPGGDIRNIANAKANWLSYLDSRVVTFSFAYRFSKGKTLNARQSGGSESEKSRVKL